jgi:hypothetical protein
MDTIGLLCLNIPMPMQESVRNSKGQLEKKRKMLFPFSLLPLNAHSNNEVYM